jgi:hypothetical protein
MSEIILALLDLADAQLQAWRQDGFRLASALVLLGMAGLLGVFGLLMLTMGIYLWVAARTGPVVASWFTGFVFLVVAGGLVWSGKRLAR